MGMMVGQARGRGSILACSGLLLREIVVGAQGPSVEVSASECLSGVPWQSSPRLGTPGEAVLQVPKAPQPPPVSARKG
jgi:hypothetical protein